MKREYDFSGGVRGKFYHPDTKINLPIYLDVDVEKDIRLIADREKKDAQTVVNTLLRQTVKSGQSSK